MQTELYSKVLTDAFAQFVPSKKVQLRLNDQPWTNSYTRLLLRKKNYETYNRSERVQDGQSRASLVTQG